MPGVVDKRVRPPAVKNAAGSVVPFVKEHKKGWVSEKFFYDSRCRVNRIDQLVPGQSTRSTRYTYLDHGEVEAFDPEAGEAGDRVVTHVWECH